MIRGTTLVLIVLLLAALPSGAGENLPEVRFRGAPTYDFGVSNVKWEAGTKDYSFVTFDLSWSFSWRTKWTEPAATSCTGKDMEVENWDAAWVFVKFLPEKDSQVAKERNHWQHSTLDKDAANHVMPAGATNTVKLSDDGSRGMGVFIYRDAIGHGANNWKGVKLRWLHGADKVDPAKAAVAVHPIAMVYVPAGPFKIGAAAKSGFSPFADGPDIPLARYDGEQSFNDVPAGLRKVIETTTSKDGGPYLQWDVAPSQSHTTDGGWRGGPMIPFLVDAEWNGPVAEGTRARRVGPVAGHLWSTHTFSERGGGGGMFGSHIGGAVPLNDDFPTGHEAFYCMKYELTQGQYVDFLNSLPPDIAAGRAFVGHEVVSDAGMHSQEIKVDLGRDRGSYTVREVAGLTIRSSADVPAPAAGGPPAAGGELTDEKKDEFDELLKDAEADKKGPTAAAGPTTLRPVYMARCPFRRIPGMHGTDSAAYAKWAGLRPISALESAKAGVGVRDPAAPADPPSPYKENAEAKLADAGLPTERLIQGLGRYGGDLAVRVGCFSTPTSDRATARATYWGIPDWDRHTPAAGLEGRGFRGAHGDGRTPAGTPGAPVKRGIAPFGDIAVGGGYLGKGRFVAGSCRHAVSAGNRIMKPAAEPAVAAAANPKQAAQFPPADARRDDIPRVANVKVEPGKEYSTVSFDLAWQNSWRAKWTEPAEKNVTGKPLTVESWDAAWVFVKFRPAGAKDDAPALLSAKAAEHAVPAGAALAVGLTDNADGSGGDGERSVGVFIYRRAVGVGPNDFKSVKLRWPHGAAVDPTKCEVKVHALAMVWIPEGPFVSRSPWGHALTLITTPDATKPGGNLDLGPEERALNPEWPNGFMSFYCMKYSISQGQYAEMLNSVPSRNYKVARRFNSLAHNNGRLWHTSYYGFNGYTIKQNEAGVFTADVPDRMCPLLTEADITFFTVWAALRLMTDLEYEKACRGPRAVAKGGDAWTPAICGPAAGLDKSVLNAPSAVGPGPSYWGLREMSLSGCMQEWPSVVAGTWGWGKKYEGTHGTGAMEDPDDWPWGWFANLYYGGIWRCAGYGTVGHWVDPTQFGKMDYEVMDGERCGRYGVRAVRTAPPVDDVESPLTLDPLPNLSGCAVALFSLAGRFKNTSAQALKLELVLPLPAACFPSGDASRVFTAAPSAVTPFKVPVLLTSQIAKAALIRKRFLPVQIRGPGDKLLAERRAQFQMVSATGEKLVFGSLDGGQAPLRLINATEQAFTAAVELPPPPDFTVTEKELRVEVGAKAEAKVSFTIPRQALGSEGARLLPYRVTIAKGAPVTGELAVELQIHSRWWLSRRVATGPKLETPDEAGADGDDSMGMSDLVSPADDAFKQAKPPKGWTATNARTRVPLDMIDPLPSTGSQALAATRVLAPADRTAVLRVQGVPDKVEGKPAEVIILVWLNDEVVFDSQADPKAQPKPRRLRKGGNPLVVEYRSAAVGAIKPVSLGLQFTDAKDGKPLAGLLFDMEAKP